MSAKLFDGNRFIWNATGETVVRKQSVYAKTCIYITKTKQNKTKQNKKTKGQGKKNVFLYRLHLK